jgi:RimJ/RimL family protein N-acetyltransferase
MKFDRVVLDGEHVRLKPLETSDLNGLCEAGLDPELWKWIPTRVIDKPSMDAYIRSALADEQKGTALPFVTIEKLSGRVVGCTRFGNIDTVNGRAEIGWTWIDPKYQRTVVNTEAKLLMLAHAFENWKCIRVELKTDALNERSRAAILRIGAKQEGIFRKHMICDTGRFRDTVFFSIIDEEWPFVRSRLLSKLGK